MELSLPLSEEKVPEFESLNTVAQDVPNLPAIEQTMKFDNNSAKAEPETEYKQLGPNTSPLTDGNVLKKNTHRVN